MCDNGAHGYDVLGLWPPYEHGQVVVEGHNKLAKFVVADGLNASALGEFFTLFVLHEHLLILAVLGDVLFVGGRGLRELTD